MLRLSSWLDPGWRRLRLLNEHNLDLWLGLGDSIYILNLWLVSWLLPELRQRPVLIIVTTAIVSATSSVRLAIDKPLPTSLTEEELHCLTHAGDLRSLGSPYWTSPPSVAAS